MVDEIDTDIKYADEALDNNYAQIFKIVDRAMSGFPVSIATGLALETLFPPIIDVVDPDRTVSKITDLSKYDAYVFNIDTIIRNVITSMSKEDAEKIKPLQLYAIVSGEITWMNGFFQEEHGLDIRFFSNTYEFYKNNYKEEVRIPSTTKQIREEKLREFVTKHLLKGPPIRTKIEQFKHVIRYADLKSILLLSHIPTDLLSYKYFKTLDLLESHTGAIKGRKDYNTKYAKVPGMDMSFLPFYEAGLVTFGDKVMFRPKPVKERLALYEHLKRAKVNPFTSELAFAMRAI